MKIKKAIGSRIRQVRGKLKLTQTQLAKELNMSVSTVSGYEIGDTYPSVEAAIQITKIGKVSLTWLFTGDATEIHEPPGADLTKEETSLIEAFRKMNRADKAALLRLAVAITKE